MVTRTFFNRSFALSQRASLSAGSLYRPAFSNFYFPQRTMADVTFSLEDFGAESISQGELGTWNFNEGDYVQVDDEICNVETDKIALPQRSQHAGVIKKLLKEEGDTIEKGDGLWIIDTDGKPPAQEEKKSEPKKEETKAESKKEETKAESTKKQDSPKPSSSKSSAPPAQAQSAPGSETRVKMNQMRKRIAKRLKSAQNTAAMLTTFQECDMSNLMQLRSEFKDQFLKTHGVKLGFMSCFVKASANALLKERAANAYITEDETEIVYKDYVDINVAVATPTGLLTPVLRDCDKMSFADVEKEIGALADKARSGKMEIADLDSGTFTISNGGVYGSLMGTPILNPPQSAILGMHGITKRPVVVNDEIVIRPMMYLALTYDHRLLDGKTAVTFLRTIKEGVEDPRTLLLDL